MKILYEDSFKQNALIPENACYVYNFKTKTNRCQDDILGLMSILNELILLKNTSTYTMKKLENYSLCFISIQVPKRIENIRTIRKLLELF